MPCARLRSAFFFFFNDTATTEIYTLSLHDALPISGCSRASCAIAPYMVGTAVIHRSEEHTSELQSRGLISYAVFCLKKKKELPSTGHADTRTIVIHDAPLVQHSGRVDPPPVYGSKHLEQQVHGCEFFVFF